MPAPSYSTLANWDGRLSQPRSTPSRPPSQSSQMPPPPPPHSSSPSHASLSNSRGRTSSASAPPGSSSPLELSAADVMASGVECHESTASTSHRPLAVSPTRARPPDVFQSGLFTSDQTRGEVRGSGEVGSTAEMAGRPWSGVTGDLVTHHPHPPDILSDFSMFPDPQQSPVSQTRLAQSGGSLPQPWFSQRARAPSQMSARSYRSSEDDDENVRRILLASQPPSPVQNKHAFGASSDQILHFEPLPVPSQYPFASHVPHNAAQPPSGPQSPFHWMPDLHLESMQTAAPPSDPRAFATEPVPLLNDLGELAYPSSASEGPDLDIQMVSNTSATSEQEAGEASATVSIEPTAGGDEKRVDTPQIDNTSWDTWVASNAARRQHNVKAAPSVPVRVATPEPAVEVTEDHSPPSPIQRAKTPLFLPSTSTSSSADVSSRPTPDDESIYALSQVSSAEQEPPSRRRSPSVEVIDPSVYSLSTGDSTLVNSDAFPRARSLRPSPAPVAGPSNVGSPTAADNGPARESSIISISSTTPDPPVRRSETARAKNRAYIELRKMLPARKRRYRPLANMPLPVEPESSDEDGAEPRAGPSRIPEPLSPTVSDYTRTSPAPASPRALMESDDDIIVLSHAPSPRIVPSSVSPPTRQTQRSPDARLPPRPPDSPGVPLRRQPVARHRASAHPGSSRRPRMSSPDPEDDDGQRWAFDLSAAYNRAHDLAVMDDEAVAPRKRKRKRRSESVEVRERAAGEKRRARRISVSSGSFEALPPPKRRKKRAVVEDELSDVQAPPASKAVHSASAEMQSSPPRTTVPSTSAPQERHSQLPTSVPPRGADGSRDEHWILQGLGDDALDPLADLCGAVPIELACDFEAWVQADHMRELDPARATLPVQLRHVFAALGLVALTNSPDKAEARAVSEELDVPLAATSKGKGRSPEARQPVTPPRTVLPGTVVPSRPSMMSMKDAREKRQKESPPSPSPPEIVRQPVVAPPVPQVIDTTEQRASSASAIPELSPKPPHPQPQHSSPHVEPQSSTQISPAAPSADILPHHVIPVFPHEQDVQPPQSFSYAYQQKQTHYSQVLQSDALRGEDAFLGMMQDEEHDHMQLDDHGGYPGYEHHPDLLALSSQWMDPSQPLPPPYSVLHEDVIMAVDGMQGEVNPALGIDPQAFAQGGIGTIDPSLLGGPVTPLRIRSPTITPSPPSVSPRRPADSDDDRDWSPHHSSPDSRMGSRSAHSAAKNKSKGKGRAADVGYRARAAQSRNHELVSCDQDEAPGDKRKRKPSTRAIEAGYRTADDEPAARKGKHVDARATSRLIDVDIAALAREVPYCHQCRCKNAYEKMRCTVIKDTGLPCGVRYCEKCIVTRYPDMEFNSMSTTFKCPRCLGYCNCTHCSRVRGEEYVPPSEKGRRQALAFSALYAESLRKEREEKALAASKAKGSRKRRSTSAAVSAVPSSSSLHPRSISAAAEPNPPPKPKPKRHVEPTPQELELAAKMALPQGAVWGTIYGLNNDKIGLGIVADGAGQKITVTRPPDLIGHEYDSRFAASSSGSDDETGDESEVDELVSTTVADSRVSATTSARAVSPTPAAPVGKASSIPPSAPPRSRGHYIGKLQPGWSRLPLGKGSEKGLVRMRGLPTVRAYVGSKAVIRRSTVVVVDDSRGGEEGDANSDPFECISGDLTPDVSEDENPAEHAPSGTSGLQSPSQRPPPGGEDLGFILARVIKAISEPPQDGLSSQVEAVQLGQGVNTVDTTVAASPNDRTGIEPGAASARDGRPVSGIATMDHTESVAPQDACSLLGNSGDASPTPQPATTIKVFPAAVLDIALLTPQEHAMGPDQSVVPSVSVDAEPTPAVTLVHTPGHELSDPLAPNPPASSDISTTSPAAYQLPPEPSQKQPVEYHESTTSQSG